MTLPHTPKQGTVARNELGGGVTLDVTLGHHRHVASKNTFRGIYIDAGIRGGDSALSSTMVKSHRESTRAILDFFASHHESRHSGPMPLVLVAPIQPSPASSSSPSKLRRSRTVISVLAPFRTLPHLQAYTQRSHVAVHFADVCLRSVGQCCFQNSPLSGMVFLVALALSSNGLCMLLLALLGCVSANAFASLMRLHPDSYVNGLFGYNATLLGCAFGTFVVGPDVWSWATHGYIVLPVLPLLSVLTVVISNASGLFLPPGTPALTFPFQFTIWTWILAAQNWAHVRVAYVTSPHLNSVAAATDIDAFEWRLIAQAVGSGLAQTFLLPDCRLGWLVVVGIALCSPVGALFAVVGAILGTLTAVGVGAAPTAVYAGLYGYNASLCAVALGGFFVKARGWRFAPLVGVGVLGSTLLTSSTSALFTAFGVPALTWPFTLMTWLLLLSMKSMPDVIVLALDDLTTPEDHLEGKTSIDRPHNEVVPV
ncbi:Aste57867_996 [Aphanomyces stellatus]|uniref:Aste57867_996 protein n=1 Tax=Aphanomyces stellatus TaxID=120398 RepID=A0A485K5A9_9STRA|nr:hypothetical protein As57867_000995 [Aphanomyces stellatus]VFT78218.1 Aste57867_996 [Aphanomyces stellatus]